MVDKKKTVNNNNGNKTALRKQSKRQTNNKMESNTKWRCDSIRFNSPDEEREKNGVFFPFPIFRSKEFKTI